MSLPDKVIAEIPSWVTWLAQDASGTWWAYEAEPNEGHNFWYENEVGRSIKLFDGQANREWRNTLQKL